jgi:SAM-dependent methyltransferase
MSVTLPSSTSVVVLCPSCQGPTRRVGRIPDAIEFAGRSLSSPLSGGSLFCCSACFLHFRWPRPAKAILNSLYNQASESAWESPPEHRTDWQLVYAILNRRDCSRLSSILDVGCYNAGFLKFLGGPWKKFGIEVNRRAAEKARMNGVEIIGSDIGELEGIAQDFDVITVFDVIEHIEDPRKFLLDLASVLSPKGLLIISTGNTSAAAWEFAGSRYYYCSIPEHLSFINPQWCDKYAVEFGLSLDECITFSHSKLGLISQVKQTCLNVLSVRLPPAIRILRRAGFGNKDATRFPELAETPPTWNSARDHFLAVFSKR